MPTQKVTATQFLTEAGFTAPPVHGALMGPVGAPVPYGQAPAAPAAGGLDRRTLYLIAVVVAVIALALIWQWDRSRKRRNPRRRAARGTSRRTPRRKPREDRETGTAGDDDDAYEDD